MAEHNSEWFFRLLVEGLRDECSEMRREITEMRRTNGEQIAFNERLLGTQGLLNKRCTDLETASTHHDGLGERVSSLEDWRSTRLRTTARLASLYGGVVGAGVAIVWELIKTMFHK